MRTMYVTGNLTRDAEVKYLSHSDKIVINFDLATNERWTNAKGEKCEKAYFTKCALWVKKPDVAKHFLKGIKVLIKGKPEAEAWTNAEGKAVGQLKINVEEFEFMSFPKNNNSSSHSDIPTPDDDLPF